MLILTESQVIVLQTILSQVLIGEAYRLRDVEECLSFLQQEQPSISCPFEKAFARSLAEEVLQAVRASQA